MNEPNTKQNNTPEKEPAPARQPEQIRRHNPRLVFNDPDKFFFDLLMEQNEQQ